MSNQTIIQEVKHLLSIGQRASISTKTFEEIIELLEHKTQLSIKQSKELIRLRKELQKNEQKNRKLLKDNEELKVLTKHWRETSMTDSQEVEKLSEQLDDDNVIIERFLIASGKSKDLTEPEEFEEVFEDIEQTYSEHEELKNENGELKAENFAFEELVKTQDNLIDDLQNKNDSIQKIADDLQRRNHDLTQMLETKEKILDEIKQIAKNDCENCCECTTEFNLKESCSIYEIQDIINGAKDKNVLHKEKETK